MSQKILKEQEINGFLESYGLSLGDFHQPLIASHASRISRNEADAPTAKGMISWLDTVRGFRERLLQKGWYKKDLNNLPLIYNPQYKILILIKSANNGCGIETYEPIVKSKGRTTIRLFEDSGIDDLFPETIIKDDDVLQFDNYEKLLFMYHFDEKNGEIRAELSRPLTLINDNGFDEFTYRIIIPVIDVDPLKTKTLKQEFANIPDIVIRRKR